MDPLRLHGRQVTLRPLVESDRARILAIRTTTEVGRWWRGEDVDELFSEDLADDELHQFAIETSAGDVVGMIQFAEEEDPEYRHASVDIFIDPSVHRRGIATDAITTLADHLFDDRGHHRLVIDPAVDNHAAIACYESIGFRRVGVMRAYERRVDGSWADGMMLDMLASDRAGRTPI